MKNSQVSIKNHTLLEKTAILSVKFFNQINEKWLLNEQCELLNESEMVEQQKSLSYSKWIINFLNKITNFQWINTLFHIHFNKSLPFIIFNWLDTSTFVNNLHDLIAEHYYVSELRGDAMSMNLHTFIAQVGIEPAAE